MSTKPHSPPPRDPDARSIITEESFRIDPQLLGKPLARPWRRACAMSVDVILIALLANTPGFLFALAAAIVLFRASAPTVSAGYFRRSMRLMLRFSAALILFALVASSWGRLATGTRGAAASLGIVAAPAASPPSGNIPAARLSTLAAGGGAAGTAALMASTGEDEAHAQAGELVASLRAEGASEEEIRSFFLDLRGEGASPWVEAAVDSALRSLNAASGMSATGPATLPSDSLALAYAGAVEQGDAEAAARLRDQLAATAGAEETGALRAEVASRDERIAGLRRELEEASRETGIMAFLRRFAEDLGLGFGWAGLYFTAFVALWNGRTPGKRLMSVRIIRLDGKPVGWWMSFERFGGYAASIVTGLLGFLQILWDRNRQAMHDKISETVVVKQ